MASIKLELPKMEVAPPAQLGVHMYDRGSSSYVLSESKLQAWQNLTALGVAERR